MPVDPSISLGVQVPQSGMASGLDTISKFATIQNALNQNALFQQTFQARQLAGQIIAAAPDLETGIKNLWTNPNTSAFAGTISNEIRQLQSTMADIASKKQALYQSGLTYTLHGLARALNDPSQLESAINQGLATVDPMAQPEVRSAMSSLVKGLGSGLPADPAAAAAKYQSNLYGTLLSAGHTVDSLNGLLGKPMTVTGTDPATGRATTQGALQAPSFTGGALRPAGPGIVGGLTPGEAVTTHPVGINRLTLQPQVATGAQIQAGQVPGLVPPGGGTAQPPIASVGAPTAPAPGQTTAIEGAAKNYTEEGRKSYDSAVTGLASIQYIDRAFDELSRGGGWETPGTAVNARLGISKGINTLAQILGTPTDKLPFDPNKVATWEEFNKESKRAGMQLINQMFGAQRESQMVFQAGTAAVPQAENTPMGGKLVLKSLEQTMLREVDRRNFETNWWNTHAGNLIGANEAFNSQYKPQLYAQRAISTIQPYEVGGRDAAAEYLPGTFVKVKGQPGTFQVPPAVSKYQPIVLQGQQ